VWNKRWLAVAFPFLTFTGVVVSGIGTIVVTLQTQSITSLANLANWSNALWAFSIATNATVTGMIAGRLYYLSSRTIPGAVSTSTASDENFANMLIESGVIYTASMLTALQHHCFL